MSRNTNSNASKDDHKAVALDVSKRELLRRMRQGAYAAPLALAMMTTKASACSLSC